MATIKTVKTSLRMAYNDLDSWRKVGAKFGITGAMAFRIVRRDYEPKTNEIRGVLGLPPSSKVIPVNGREIPNGTQALVAEYCIDCGQPFISNHPRRRKCFICSPYRGKRRT
jgi:hypothetical protein